MKMKYIIIGSVVFYALFLRKKEIKTEVNITSSLDNVETTIKDFVGDILKDSLKSEAGKEDKGKALEEKAQAIADKIKANVGISTTAGAVSKITTSDAPVSSAPAALVKPSSPITTDSVVSKEDALLHAISDLKSAVENKGNEGNTPAVSNDRIGIALPNPIAEPVSTEPITAPSTDFLSQEERERLKYRIFTARGLEWTLPAGVRDEVIINRHKELKQEILNQYEVFFTYFTKTDVTNLLAFFSRKKNETYESIRMLMNNNEVHHHMLPLMRSYVEYIEALERIILNQEGNTPATSMIDERHRPIAEPVSTEPISELPIEGLPELPPEEPELAEPVGRITPFILPFNVYVSRKVYRIQEQNFEYPSGLPPRYRRRYEELKTELSNLIGSVEIPENFTEQDFEQYKGRISEHYQKYVELSSSAPNSDIRELYEAYINHLNQVKTILDE